jgi:hypothetical protein
MPCTSFKEVPRFRGIESTQFVQVGTPHEGAVAFAGDDQETQVWVIGQGADDFDECHDLGLAETIQPCGVVDGNGDHGPVMVAANKNRLVCHDVVL